MSSAWLRIVLSLWPLFLGALLYAEFSAYWAARRLVRPRLVVAALLFVVLLVLQYWTQPTSYATQTRPLAYFFVVVWVTLVPLVALSIGAHLLARVSHAAIRQVGLFVLAGGVIAALPVFALWSICASGVDCI